MFKLALWLLIGYLSYRALKSALAVWRVVKTGFPPGSSARAEVLKRRPVEAQFEEIKEEGQ